MKSPTSARFKELLLDARKSAATVETQTGCIIFTLKLRDVADQIDKGKKHSGRTPESD
jgi:hypothetical protein